MWVCFLAVRLVARHLPRPTSGLRLLRCNSLLTLPIDRSASCAQQSDHTYMVYPFACWYFILSRRQEDEVPSDFQDYSLVTLVGAAAHLMHQPIGDGAGLDVLAVRYGHDIKALDQVKNVPVITCSHSDVSRSASCVCVMFFCQPPQVFWLLQSTQRTAHSAQHAATHLTSVLTLHQTTSVLRTCEQA